MDFVFCCFGDGPIPGYAGEVMKFAYAEASQPLSWVEGGQVRGILIDIVNLLL